MIEIWDINTYCLIRSLPVPNRERASRARASLILAGSIGFSPPLVFAALPNVNIIYILRVLPTEAIAEQRIEALEPSRKRVNVVCVCINPS